VSRAIAMERQRREQEQEELDRLAGREPPPKPKGRGWKILAIVAGGAAIYWMMSPSRPSPIQYPDPRAGQDPGPRPTNADAGDGQRGRSVTGEGEGGSRE
jgi:hypothetical protein